jgi:hypothetical protein
MFELTLVKNLIIVSFVINVSQRKEILMFMLEHTQENDSYPADQNIGHLRISQLRYYAILWIFSRYHFVILLNCCHFDIH